MQKPEPVLILNDARGVYIPRDFTIHVARERVAGVTDDDWAILAAGPDHELYWDAWDDVTQAAIVTDDNGAKYSVHQDGDCWLIPVGMEWSEETDSYIWPEADNDA
jgi:hypothetical protein